MMEIECTECGYLPTSVDDYCSGEGDIRLCSICHNEIGVYDDESE